LTAYIDFRNVISKGIVTDWSNLIVEFWKAITDNKNIVNGKDI